MAMVLDGTDGSSVGRRRCGSHRDSGAGLGPTAPRCIRPSPFPQVPAACRDGHVSKRVLALSLDMPVASNGVNK